VARHTDIVSTRRKSVTSFDERAATWDDDPAKVVRAQVVAEKIRSTVSLTGTERLLEYGAGTGLLSESLQDAVGPVTMADTSAGMRQVMQSKVDAGLIPGARVWDVDLAGGDEPPDERFDLVVTVLALHHIDDVDRALRNFARLIEPGGHLCIVDLDHEDGSFHGEGFEGHHGFVRADLAERLQQAGFADTSFQACHHVERNGADFPMFLATSTR
jgi:ubiquinone/menaquinone biosynthesis C-methylase UbiE